MKKFIQLFFAIIFLTIGVSCNEEVQDQFKPIETEEAIVIDDAVHYDSNHSRGYYHLVVKGDNLNDIAKRYLKDRTRWGELIILNPYLGNEADTRNYRVSTGPAWIINPGDIVMLPNDAQGAQSNGSFNSVTFYLGEDLIEEYTRKIPVERDMSKLYQKISSQIDQHLEKDSDFQWPQWLNNLLWWLVLFIIMAFLIYWLFPLKRNNHNQKVCVEICCDECKESNCCCRIKELEHIKDAFIEVSKNKGTTEISYENVSGTKTTMKHTSQ